MKVHYQAVMGWDQVDEGWDRVDVGWDRVGVGEDQVDMGQVNTCFWDRVVRVCPKLYRAFETGSYALGWPSCQKSFVTMEISLLLHSRNILYYGIRYQWLSMVPGSYQMSNTPNIGMSEHLSNSGT